jgi:phage gp46-like protein
MSDIKIIWNNDFFEGDIGLDLGDLILEDGIETAVLMSLFSDRRATEEDSLPDPSNTDLKGWWGDQVADFPGDEIGSLLWLLSRSKTTQDTLVKAEAYVKDALQWLIDDGVTIRNEVVVERVNRPDHSAILALHVKLYQSDGTVVALTYDNLWRAQFRAA